jgi:nucleotide-binding universal stress UspA family protein
MYKTILVPTDLAHAAKLEKALAISADMAKLYDAKLHVVGVTASAPGSVAHNPIEYAERLEAFAAEQSKKRGVEFKSHMITSPDPVVDLDKNLKSVANDIGADLVVMASHIPGVSEYIFASNAGYLASHSDLSVFVVR